MECVHGVYVKQQCYECLRSLLENTEKDLTDLAWRYSTLQKENTLLKSCVEFYADKRMDYKPVSGMESCNLKYCIDHGDKARETLKELEGGE